MANAAVSARARFVIRSLGWGTVVACVVIFFFGRSSGTFEGLVVAQVAFDVLLALAVGGCSLAYLRVRRSNPFEARLWAKLTIAVAFLLGAEVYYSAYQIAVDVAGPASPSPFEILSALAAIAYLMLIWSMSRLRILPFATLGRLISGMAGQMVAVFAVLLWGVARPLASGVPHSFADPILWVVYMCVGIAVLVGTFTDVFGSRVDRWTAWETLTASSLVLVGLALVLWPYWYRAAATSAAAERYHLLSVLLALSYGMAFLGSLYRVTQPERRWREAALPSPAITSGSMIMVSTTQALAIPVLGLMLYLRPVGSPDRLVLVGLISCLTLALVARTAFLSAETLEARIRTAKDSLTGALRRPFFAEQLEAVVGEARTHGEPVSVAVFDIDDFTRTNVIEGHATGDAVLAALGAAVRSMLKPADRFGRLGGDEFALCLRDTDLPAAMQRLRHDRIILNEAMSIGTEAVTLSFGVAAFPAQATDAEGLLRAADGALYWAKYGGKNRVIAYSEIVMHALDAEARLLEIEQHSRLDVVRALAAATDARDPATAYHSRNVAALAVLLASAIGLDS